jgi:hypothetical protein
VSSTVVDGATAVAPLLSRSHSAPVVPTADANMMTIPIRARIRCIALSSAVRVCQLAR